MEPRRGAHSVTKEQRMKRITKVLVANRGEIARRIFATCRDEGIQTAAVFTEADRSLPFVQEADSAMCIGTGVASESYLDTAKILDAAHAMGADAIHPGYGFLSENSQFATAVESAGLIWIGPPPEAIDSMGDKVTARTIADKHNVPTVPGFDGSQDVSTLKAAAEKIGYPVLIKATAGGGGRGMRRVNETSQFDASVQSAQREALSAFGNGDVFLEKFVEHPRHIEVQIIADAHGTILHLGERECSVQRRHQKVIEEAPSPAVNEALRASLGEAAVRMAEAVSYTGAGTVEFIMNDSGAFYFLEMNTRLQVEHPVTEMVTGLDLVALQIKVAEGHPLDLSQSDIHLNGHSIESRIYAEDPARDYAPGTGPLLLCSWPTGRGVRVDAGFTSGNVISPFYDSMLAKVVVWGRDRTQATQRMNAALRNTWVVGPPNNIPLLKDVFSTSRWRSGELETGFLELEKLPQPAPLNLSKGALAATCLRWWLQRTHAPWSREIPAGWRVEGALLQTDTWQSFGEEAKVCWKAQDSGLDITVTLEGSETSCHEVRHVQATDHQLSAEVNGVRQTWAFHIDRSERRPSPTIEDNDRVFLHLGDGESLVQLVPRLPAPQAIAEEPGTLTAATPGTVVKVLVAIDDTVETGQTLIIIEAMKMEQRLTASAAGRITAVLVDEGETVDQGTTLIRMECEES